MSQSVEPRPNRRPRSGLSLLLQLFAFVVLPLTALLIVVAIGSLYMHAQAMRDLVSERNERAARAAAAALDEQLAHRAAAVRGLAVHAASQTAPEQALAGYDFLLPSFEGGLAVFASDGQLLAELPGERAAAWLPELAALALAGDASPTSPWFSAVQFDQAGAARLLVAAAVGPVTVVGDFSPARMTQRTLTDTFMSNPQAFAAVFDGAGQVLFQVGESAGDEPALAQHPGVAEALRGESGRLYLKAGNSEHVVAYAPIRTMGWALLVEEPWEAVDNPMLSQTQAAPLILVPVLIVALLALGFGVRQIVQPLRALERQARDLGWGRYEAIEAPVGGIAEIQHLQAELARMAAKVKAAQQNLRGYLGAITAGQEDERRRLARELHDGAIQSLIALDQRTQLAQHALKDDPSPATKHLGELRQMTAQLMEEVRRVIRALRPIYLEDLGLLPALEMLVRDTETVTGIPAAFTLEGQSRRLTAAQEIALYRIVQEALNNAARYAGARAIQVQVAFPAGALTVQVQDDGQGFTAPERVSDLAASGHYGLMGMQERAELIGAQLSIQSAPGAGTTILVRLPLAGPGA